MTSNYFYFHLDKYPVSFITKVGSNKQDLGRLRMLLNKSINEEKQTFMLEEYSFTYDKWQELDTRVRDQKRYVDFYDLWRFHFSPLHQGDWDWLICRSKKY